MTFAEMAAADANRANTLLPKARAMLQQAADDDSYEIAMAAVMHLRAWLEFSQSVIARAVEPWFEVRQ